MDPDTFSRLDNILNAASKLTKAVEYDMKALKKHSGCGEDNSAYADAGTVQKEMAKILESLNEAKRVLRKAAEDKLPK